MLRCVTFRVSWAFRRIESPMNTTMNVPGGYDKINSHEPPVAHITLDRRSSHGIHSLQTRGGVL